MCTRSHTGLRTDCLPSEMEPIDIHYILYPNYPGRAGFRLCGPHRPVAVTKPRSTRNPQDGCEPESPAHRLSPLAFPGMQRPHCALCQPAESVATGAQGPAHSPATLFGRRTSVGTASSHRFYPPARARRRYAVAACWPGRRLYTQTRQLEASPPQPHRFSQVGIAQAPGVGQGLLLGTLVRIRGP